MSEEETQAQAASEIEAWFCGRDDGQPWTGPNTRDDAIAEGREHYSHDGGAFEIATGRRVGPTEFLPSASDVLEQIQTTAYDTVGESCESIEADEEGMKALDDALEAWANKHLDCSVWAIEGAHETIESAVDEDEARDRARAGESDGES